MRHIARLERYHGNFISASDSSPPRQIQADRSYLLTGGLGGLGLEVARWLVEQGARQLVLTGRTGVTTATTQQAIQALEQAGAKVLVVQADVTQPGDVARVLAESQALAPLAGIFHLAGVSEYGTLLQQSATRFANVIAPKVFGTWHLHTATAGMALDFVVYFSSGAALLGLGWNGSYAAANCFMDALAHHRRTAGLPALSINWGPWADAGMVATESTNRQDSGIMALSTAQGLQLLGDLMAQNATQVGVMAMNWPKFLQQLPVDGNYPLLTNWRNRHTQRLGKSSVWLPRLNKTEPAQRPQFIATYLQEQIGSLLGLNPDQYPEAHQSTLELGLDSLMNIELSNRIKRDLAIRVPTVKFLEGNSLAQMSAYMNRLKTTQELQRSIEDSAATEREAGRL